jgi:hypothetical protein
MNGVVLWTGQWITKLLDFLFWIRLRTALRGCRNLLRTSEREGATGTEPRIRTVRQLTAAAGDGLLGSVGSPGQLETSLNSGYQWAPATHTWRGPHPFIFGGCSRMAPEAAYFVVTRRRSSVSARYSSARRRRHCRRSQPVHVLPTSAASGPRFLTLVASKSPIPTLGAEFLSTRAGDFLALAAPRGPLGSAD